MHHFPTPTPPQLTVEFGAGSIHIDAVETDETIVDLRPVHDDAPTHELLAKTVIEQRGDVVVVFVPRRHARLFGRTPELALTVTAPRDTKLQVKSSSADITASGAYGTSVIDTGSGDVSIAELTESVRVRNGSGLVDLASVAGDADVKTGSGDVRVGAVGGSSVLQSGSGNVVLGDGGTGVRVSTGSGDVSIDRIATDIEATTGSGDIAVARVESGDVRVRAASGDVRVGVAEGTSAWLDASTVSGRARSELVTTETPDADGKQVSLRLVTVSGDIDIVRA